MSLGVNFFAKSLVTTMALNFQRNDLNGIINMAACVEIFADNNYAIALYEFSSCVTKMQEVGKSLFRKYFTVLQVFVLFILMLDKELY